MPAIVVAGRQAGDPSNFVSRGGGVEAGLGWGAALPAKQANPMPDGTLTSRVLINPGELNTSIGSRLLPRAPAGQAVSGSRINSDAG